MKENERDEVGRFVDRTMRERYGSEAYALSEIVFTAWQSGEDRRRELLGAMALAMSHGKPFHLEEIYALDYRTFPDIFERTRIVQLGRWTANVPGISGALLYAAILYARHHGRSWGIGEVKPWVARRFARMGIAVTVLSGSPTFANIPKGALPYYLKPPAPVPAAIVLAQAEAALRAKVVRLVTEGEIALHY